MPVSAPLVAVAFRRPPDNSRIRFSSSADSYDPALKIPGMPLKQCDQIEV